MKSSKFRGQRPARQCVGKRSTTSHAGIAILPALLGLFFILDFGIKDGVHGAEEGTRTPTPLRVHGPEPCASANSATSASDCVARRRETALKEETAMSILTGQKVSVKLSGFRFQVSGV